MKIEIVFVDFGKVLEIQVTGRWQVRRSSNSSSEDSSRSERMALNESVQPKKEYYIYFWVVVVVYETKVKLFIVLFLC